MANLLSSITLPAGVNGLPGLWVQIGANKTKLTVSKNSSTRVEIAFLSPGDPAPVGDIPCLTMSMEERWGPFYEIGTFDAYARTLERFSVGLSVGAA